MAFSFVGNAPVDRGSSTTSTVTHGLTINEGDLVVAYINRNGTATITADAGGTTFNVGVDDIVSGETARQILFWKIAGASEPSSYGFTFGSFEAYQTLLVVMSSTTDAVVDAAATIAVSTTSMDIICNAIDGAVISDNAVSFVFGGKDNRLGSDTWATVDNSYTGVLGNTGDQDSAGAHRIYTTGETFSGSVTFTDPGDSRDDLTYNIHMSFVEPTAPPSGIQIFRRRMEGY